MAKYRFRIVRGTYVGNGADGVEVIHEPKSKTAIIETDTNLAKRFGRDKFQRLDAGDEEDATVTKKTKAPVFSIEELDNMTVDDLRSMAAEEEIDLGGATKKADIVNKIAEAMSNRE